MREQDEYVSRAAESLSFVCGAVAVPFMVATTGATPRVGYALAAVGLARFAWNLWRALRAPESPDA